MKVCQHCQAEIKQDNLFCGVCGEKYESEETTSLVEEQEEQVNSEDRRE